jgi:hypothetical protein
MTLVRKFNSLGRVVAKLGTGGFARGPLTFVSYAKRAAEGNEWLIAYGPSAGPYVTMGVEAGNLLFYKSGGSVGPATSSTAWRLYVGTKATGEVKPKFYIYDFALEEWVADEVLGSVAMGDSPEEPPEHLVFGVWGTAGSEQFRGRMAAAAVYKRELSKAEVHSLITLGSVSEWLTTSPDGLWRFDETLPADLTGGGADATETPNTELLEETLPFPYGEKEGGGGGKTVKVKSGGSVVTAKRWVKSGGILVPA